MARTGKWPARISLALSIAMIAALFSVISASGQQSGGTGVLTVGIEVQSASITQATYSIVVRNQGTAPTTGVRVRSKVPENMTFESSDPAPVTTTSPGSGATSCENGGVRETQDTTCEWSLGTLNPGESRTITAIYNLTQTNIDSDRLALTATATDNEGHSNSDTDESLVRQRATPSDDTWVDDAELPNTNHGGCEYLRVLQGNRITSFLDFDSLGTAPAASDTAGTTNSIEMVYGAQLRLEVLDTTYTTQTPGLIGTHRITSGEWSEGTGSCQGTVSTTTTDARTGAEPTSAPGATGSSLVSAASQVVNWDVTADLDSDGERGSFQGWELRDQAATGTDNSTRFHSTESTQGQVPRLFLVYTTVESPTCIDADPETATPQAGTEHVMTAFVTDGARTPATTNNPSSAPDGCNGGPVATPVEWEIEDDIPDIYFSSQEGQAIPRVVSGDNAGPNQIETSADNSGLTSAGVRLDDPIGTDNTNRIEARIKGATGDPDPTSPGPTAGTCGQVTIPVGKNCSGETAQFDDMSITWVAQSSGSTTSGGTTTTTTTSGGTTGSTTSGSTTTPSSAGSSSTGSPSTTSSTSSAPSSTASTTGGTTGGTTSGTSSSASQSARTVSLFASSNTVVYPGQVTLSGTILSADTSCRDAGEFVQVQRRLPGESQYTDFESDNTDAEGRYEISFQALQNAEYVAVAPRHDQCADATSSPENVLVKVKVTGRSGRRSVQRGGTTAIVGRVQPDHDGTDVVLQRKKGRRFVAIARAELNVRSRYRFVTKVNWSGKRVFRVVWKAQDDDHESNRSRNVVIRSTRR